MRFISTGRIGTDFVVRSKRKRSWEYETALEIVTPVELNDDYFFDIGVLAAPNRSIVLDNFYKSIYSRTKIMKFTINKVIEVDKVKEFSAYIYAELPINGSPVFAITDLMYIP